MATYKSDNVISLVQDFTRLSCDVCGSIDVTETRAGYVCRSCGIVLEIQRLQYNRPYNDDIIQYAKGLGTTQIGTQRERFISSNSSALNRLNKHNSSKSNEKVVKEKVRIEISRIFTCLDLVGYDDIKQMVYDKFVVVRKKLRSRSKFRNINKLVSVMTYFCLKLRAIPVNAATIIQFSDIGRKEFNAFFLQIRRYLPRLTDKQRQDCITQRILDISETFGLGMPFYYYSKKILDKFWNGIKNTTDNVVAGLVCSIAVLTSYKDQVSVSSICKRLDIKMSTIQVQVSEKIVSKFRVGTFITLIKSAGMLQEIIKRVGLLNSEDVDLKLQEVADGGRVEIILGKVQDIFNGKDTPDYYSFVFADSTCLTEAILQSGSLIDNSELYQPCFEITNFNLMIYKHYNSKGPPVIVC
ncbi:hypothetical protein LCGC14_1499340 [marine sediment metagenome]|uniref:TFIIB-type domain-containing protein n=1 Tax=marine sediment metagenome TaxID=412755 RepID=A0A0F9JQE0_9ZZZZ